MAELKFPVEATHILMFARSIGDTNPIYADAAYAAGTEPGSVIAPPTFPRAVAQFDPDYHLRPKPDEPWFGSAKEPTGLPGGSPDQSQGILHAEQHFDYHRPMRPGDLLTVTSRPGKSWEKEGRRSGKLRFSETIDEYRDETGELVVTARSVVVRTERPADSA